MLSSTSSSERQTAARSYVRLIVVTLAFLALLLAGLEMITRIGFSRISRIESRTASDHRAALAIRQGGPAHPTILLLGNSLLLEAFDYDGLKSLMEPRATPVRFTVEQTSYLDWRYGIERLLSDGARPDRIVFSISLPQLMKTGIRGESSAYHLFRAQDIPDVGRELGYGLSPLSGLYFARYSMFYAGRNDIRNFILFRLARGYATALQGLAQPAPESSDEEILDRGTSRLRKLREICAPYNVQLDFLLPPSSARGGEAFQEAGRRAGVRILTPVPLNTWPQNLYRDGFHLNAEGAGRFTKMLASVLLEPR